jgi:hypothetical protein
MGVFQPSTGMPGVSGERVARHRVVTADGYLDFAPGGIILDGLTCRDPDNPDYNLTTFPDAQSRLRAGLLLGRELTGTFTTKYSNSVIGITQGAIANGATTFTITVQEAVELARRLSITSSTSVVITGGSVANTFSSVRQLTVNNVSVNTVTGVVTMPAIGVNEVQTLNFQNAPSGTFNLVFVDLNGAKQVTGPITYSGTIATLITNIQTAVNTALGANIVVVGGGAVTAVTLTFSGTGYAGLPQTLVGVDENNMTAGNISVTRSTIGVSGGFVTGSFVGATDGSSVPMTFTPDGWDVLMPLFPNTNGDCPLSQPPIRGNIYFQYLLPSPTDLGLIQWVKNALNTNGQFVFTDAFTL